MKRFKFKLAFISAIIAALLMLPCFVFAQEAANENSATELQIDETVTAADLGVGEQNVLPGSFWYPFKEIWRGARLILTVDKMKKAEMRLENANERIIEVQKLVEENGDEQAMGRVEKTMERYQKDMEKAQEAISQVEEKIEDNPRLEQFVEVLTSSEINKRKVLQKLESNENIPEKALERVVVAKEKSGEKFGEIIQEIVPGEKIVEKIEGILVKQSGSELKDIKQLQIIKDIKENVSPEMRERLEKVEVNRIDNLGEKLKQATVQVRERVENYLEETSGNEVGQLEVINDIKTKASVSGALRNGLEQIEEMKTKVFEDKVQGIQDGGFKEKVLNRIETGGEIIETVKEKLQARPVIKEAIIQNQERQREMVQEQKGEIIQKQEEKREQAQEHKDDVIQKQEEKREMIQEKQENKGTVSQDKLEPQPLKEEKTMQGGMPMQELRAELGSPEQPAQQPVVPMKQQSAPAPQQPSSSAPAADSGINP
ncbi:MAG: DUF5667 domain-containing protein [Patescibacteria group bacterium]|jgi:hypothetical protein